MDSVDIDSLQSQTCICPLKISTYASCHQRLFYRLIMPQYMMQCVCSLPSDNL